MTEFRNFQLDEKILEAIEKMGYQNPTPIQALAIPQILEGCDLIALAQTGSGKTAACTIPICNQVDLDNNSIQKLIIVPTRELALQYATEAQKIGKYRGVKTFAMYGGEDGSLQEAKLQAGVHVLIATPGRLIDFIFSRRIDLSHIDQLILDEADEMLSMGFYEDLEFIINCLVHKHQTLLFSATMPVKIKDLAKKHMNSPVEVSLVHAEASPRSLKHQFLYCRPHEKDQKLAELMETLRPSQSIIFVNSRRQCEILFKFLKVNVRSVDFLHGGLSQDVRRIITGKFRQGKVKHLVATDVAARGLDFTGVTHVFIYNLADDPDTYVHRSGRTGRSERKGTVTTMVSKRELSIVKRVIGKVKCDPVWLGEEPAIDERHVAAGPQQRRQRRRPPRRRPPKRDN